MMHATCPLRSGVTVRLNIPSYSRHNVWSQTYKRNHAGNDFSDAAQAACSDDVMIRQLLAKREIAKSEQFNVLMVLSIALYQIVSNVRMPDTSRSRVQAPSSERSTKGSSVHRQTYAVFSFRIRVCVLRASRSSNPERANDLEVHGDQNAPPCFWTSGE
jgi:hypothetical protein